MAVVLYASTLRGWLLSDDLTFLNFLVHPEGSGTGVDWSKVWSHFGRPWTFGDEVFYRPLVTVSFGVDWSLGGGSIAWLHATNVLLHAVAAGLAGALAGVLSGRGRVGLLCGTLFALHPAGHEVVCWLVARADSLSLVFSLSAALFFRRALISGSRVALWMVALCSALALCCKETAVLLPLELVAVDLLVRGTRGSANLRQRIRPHLALAPVWIGYLVLRLGVLGKLVGYTHSVADTTAATWLEIQWTKMLALVCPGTGVVPWVWRTAITGITVGALALGLVDRRTRLWTGVGVMWALLQFLPPQWGRVTPDLYGGRLVYRSALGLYLALGMVFAAGGSARRRMRWAVPAVAVILMLSLAVAATVMVRRYHAAWTDLEEVQRQLELQASAATEDRPLGLLFATREGEATPFLESFAMYPLLETPVARRDHPFVGLASVLMDLGPPAGLPGDAAPLRVLWRRGSPLLYWSKQRTGGRLANVAPRDPDRRVELAADGAGSFRVAGAPIPPWYVEGCAVVSSMPFQGGRLTWFGEGRDGPLQGETPFGAGSAQGPRGEGPYQVEVDLSHDPLFLLGLGEGAGVRGFRVALDGSPANAEVRLSVLDRLPSLRLARRLRGRVVPLSELDRWIEPPELPGAAANATVRVALLNASIAFEGNLEPGGRVELSADLVDLLRRLRDFVHVDRFYYYFECRSGSRGWRSDLDWFVLDVTR